MASFEVGEVVNADFGQGFEDGIVVSKPFKNDAGETKYAVAKKKDYAALTFRAPQGDEPTGITFYKK